MRPHSNVSSSSFFRLRIRFQYFSQCGGSGRGHLALSELCAGSPVGKGVFRSQSRGVNSYSETNLWAHIRPTNGDRSIVDLSDRPKSLASGPTPTVRFERLAL
jgi:hypothetical protein